jgi:hypothetical protein
MAGFGQCASQRQADISKPNHRDGRGAFRQLLEE